MNRRKVLHIAVVAAFGLQMSAAWAQQGLPDRIKLGLLASFTGGQVNSSASPVAGARMAIAEINKAGGIAGKQVDIVQGDDQSDPTAAVSEARRLATSEKVHVMLGPNSSQLTLAIAPVMNQAKIFHISTSGSTLLTPQLSNYHFSINPPADASGKAMVVYADETLKAKSIAWLSDNGAQSKAALEAVKEEATRRGMKVTEQEFPLRAPDITPQLLSLRSGKPDVLFIWPNTGEDHGTITKNMKELGWKLPIIGGIAPTFLVAPAKKVDPTAYEGFVSVGMRAVSYCPNDVVGRSPYATFNNKVKAFDPANYDKLAITNVGWFYDAAYILKAAIEATRSVDGPTLTKWVEQNASKVPNMATGPYSASATNHFFYGDPHTLAMVEAPDKPRSDGLLKRAGC
jgi:branched-chain amino acid transport system substrate-binding protein